MTKFYVDPEGNYLGGFDGVTVDGIYIEPAIPENAIEIPSPPAHALDKLVDGAWVPYVAPPEKSPQEKLQSFLADNPDVLALVTADKGGGDGT